MGDIRFDQIFERVKHAADRVKEIHSLTDDEVISALGGATRAQDPLIANILATEAQNRAARSHAITAALGEGVIAMDRSWHITMQNPASERMLGWSSSEFVGGDIHALIHPFCNRPDECHLGSLPPADFFYQNDNGLVMRKDGRTIRVAYTITPMMRGEEVDGGVLVLRDASERKRQEEKSSLKQDQLSIILQSLAEGVLTMDLKGRITYANAAAERIIGRAARDITERTYFDPEWNFVDPSGAPMPVTELPFKEVLDTGVAVLDVELGIRRGDGTIAFINTNTIPIPDANGKDYALLVSFLDVSARVHAERVRRTSAIDIVPETKLGAGADEAFL